jgi:type IV pilus assembly protein PilN
MRITLNLATRPFADLGPVLKRLRIAMGVLALVAIALGFGLRALDQKAQQARNRAQSLDDRIARINFERQGYQAMMREPLNAAVLAQAENLNQIFDEKAFSWTLAMEDLETVLPGGVQVTTLEPTRDQDGHITLHLRVLGARDRAIALVQNLEHSRRFLRPRIEGESSETSGGPNERLEPVSASNRVNFELLADYNPALPGERGSARTKAADGQKETSALRSLPPTPPGAHRPPYTGMPRPQAKLQPRAGGPQ